jgi:hypothetical protein
MAGLKFLSVLLAALHVVAIRDARRAQNGEASVDRDLQTTYRCRSVHAPQRAVLILPHMSLATE